MTFHDHSPRVVWPAPGLPALLEGEARRIEFIIAHTETGLDPLFNWARRLALRDRRQRQRVELAISYLEPLERSAVSKLARRFAELPEAQHLRFARLVAHTPPGLSPAPPRSSCVLDVMVGDAVERSNAVGILAPRARLALAFASDLHVAAFWQIMGEAVSRFAPDLAPKFLHPGRLLDRFIDQANRLAARGDLDLVILGGDLVDHVHPHASRVSHAGETNVARLVEALSRLEVPAIVLPGNHDHRSFPWRPRLPGLGAVGIPAGRSSRILRDAGLWDPWPVRPSDRHNLRTEDETGRPGLAYHLALLAPATDFHLTVRGMQLVFASTGRDVLPRWREVEWSRLGFVLRSLRSSWEDPDCEGFTDAQLAAMAGALDGTRGAALFFHAPLLNPHPHEPVEKRLARLDPGDRDDPAAQIAFERRLFATGLRRGVVFRNVGPLIRMLASHRHPLAVFSGHVHRSSAIAFDRISLRLRSTPFAPPHAADQTVSLLTAPALGHVRFPGSEPPGYLLASFEDGRLAALERRPVG
ncbi:MAG TPA: metallophosphoesterase [Candidatus Margulisiibacteriota bacterium]|nr:metallophosphoesterase [Candidatus Margulisiibacteriota bacterium]